MRVLTIRWCLSALLIGILTACSSLTLIEANKDFVDLMQTTEEARRLYDDGVLDAASFESAMDGYRTAFAEAGREAAEAAQDAGTPQSEVSFLNLAVRNYVKSGPIGEIEVPNLADKGIALCQSKDMQGLSGLPVTCGYFYVATAQAVSNEWSRETAALKRQNAVLRKRSPRGFLTAAQGQQLEKAFAVFIRQLQVLDANGKI